MLLMTLNDLRNLKPEIDFHSKLIREIIAAVEHWKDFKTASILTREKEKPVIDSFVSTLDKPPTIYSGHGKVMIFITRDLVQPAVIYLATIYQFDPNFDCELEYRNYQRHRRSCLLRWIKSIYRHYKLQRHMQQILIAGLVLKEFTLRQALYFTRQWKSKDSAVIQFLQSIGILSEDTFTDTDIRNAENFIVDTIKTYYPNEIEIYKSNSDCGTNDCVLSFFNSTIDLPFGRVNQNYKVDKTVDIPDAEIIKEESLPNFIPFEVYQRHKNIVDAFKDDSTLIYDSDAKLYPSTAQIGNVEHPPRDKPSMLDKARALKELRRLDND